VAEAQIAAVLASDVNVFACGIGAPAEAVAHAKSDGKITMALVGSPRHAEAAIRNGAEVIVAQGYDAGAHTGQIGTFSLVPQVVDACGDVPVLAAGGVATGRHIAASFALGAQGVWLGTSWLTTHEHALHEKIVAKLLAAGSEDTVISRADSGKTLRQIRTAWSEEWSSPNAPAALKMPYQDILVGDLLGAIDEHEVQALMHHPAGQSIAFTLDEDVFIERGQVIARADSPPQTGHRVAARVFWLGEEPLRLGDRLALRVATARYVVTVAEIRHVVDVEALDRRQADSVALNDIAEVVLRSRAKIAFDSFEDDPRLGRAVLVRDHRIVGGCVLTGAAAAAGAAERDLTEVVHSVSGSERAEANGHRGGVVWLTGLSGAGKSTLAMAAQRRLFDRGDQVYVLDGDNVRLGLNKDLGFSAEARAENIRRVAEVARLFADAGMIVLTAFISPYRADREAARAIVGANFLEVHLDADLAVCESRDPKGLYRKARAGEIADFTGISAPYEAPDSPELTVDTGAGGLDQSADLLVEAIDRAFAAGARQRRKAG